MCDSHSTGFDAGSLSNLPRSPFDGPYAPVVKAARTVALRRRRRRTVRETNAARTNKSKIRVTYCLRQPGGTLSHSGGGFKPEKMYTVHGMEGCVSLCRKRGSEWDMTDGRGTREEYCYC